MVARIVGLLAILAATASATEYSKDAPPVDGRYPINNVSLSNAPTLKNDTLSIPATNSTPGEVVVNLEEVVYTTICPETAYTTIGTKTYVHVFTTVSTITSCKGGCHHGPTPVPKPDCEKAHDDCVSQINASMSYCTSQYYACAKITPPSHPAPPPGTDNSPPPGTDNSPPPPPKDQGPPPPKDQGPPPPKDQGPPPANKQTPPPTNDQAPPAPNKPVTPVELTSTGGAAFLKAGYAGLSGVLALAYFL